MGVGVGGVGVLCQRARGGPARSRPGARDPERGSRLPCPRRQLSAPCGGAGCSCGVRMGRRPGSVAERPEGPAEACSDPRLEARCRPPAKGA